jgi:hypothetical protein
LAVVSDEATKKREPEADGDEGEGEEEKGKDKEKPSRLGKFIQTYHGFLSTFVIGAAGLIATSIWQYKQSEIATRQAESQQKIAATQAENSWRIERAEILSKNLQVLASHGGATVDQRYGVLLSLTRGNILDPELAVSYALELGKDNPEDMKSVLESTADKSYGQLAQAFVLTCDQRFGLTRDVPLCKSDPHAERSAAIAQVIADDMGDWQPGAHGPVDLLHDERQVQNQPARLAWLFQPYLIDLYERRQWDELDRFQKQSTGAHLISSLVLAAAHEGDLVTSAEATRLEKFHADQRKWLTAYLLSPRCEAECKGKLVDVMVSGYEESMGDYDEPLRQLLARTRAENGPAIARLHARLLWCQVDAGDLLPFRDHVLVPVLASLLAQPKPDTTTIDDLAGLLALAPQPTPAEAAPLAAWKGALDRLHKVSADRWQRAFGSRRASADHERANPPRGFRQQSFCNAAELVDTPTPSMTDE